MASWKQRWSVPLNGFHLKNKMVLGGKDPIDSFRFQTRSSAIDASVDVVPTPALSFCFLREAVRLVASDDRAGCSFRDDDATLDSVAELATPDRDTADEDRGRVEVSDPLGGGSLGKSANSGGGSWVNGDVSEMMDERSPPSP